VGNKDYFPVSQQKMDKDILKVNKSTNEIVLQDMLQKNLASLVTLESRRLMVGLLNKLGFSKVF